MGAGKRAQNYARPVAELIGIAADDPIVRYGVLSLTFLFLAAAAYLLGPVALTGAIATLAVALGLIIFIVYWWFLEEARKRRVMLLEEQPRANDSHNPDLRDEVVFACVVLFIITAMLLQTLNDTSLHYTVADDVLGIKALACADAMPGSFCAENTRLFELPAWLFFTLQSFVTTIPMADQVGDYAANMTGVKPTAETPVYVATALRFVFGGLLFTVVIGSFQKVGRQIESSIDVLTRTHTFAAGMGPIVITRLNVVLDDASQEPRWNNALLALADIAHRYQGARREVETLFADCLAAKFSQIDPQTKDRQKLARLEALTTVFCAIQSDRGLNLVFDRIQQTTGLVRTKIRLVKTVADKLDDEIAVEFFQQLDPALMSKLLARAVGNALSDLDATMSDGDGDCPTPTPPLSTARTDKKIGDGRQGDLPLDDQPEE
jgi:hypothetical protein